jgi:hypothetical protein
VSQTRGMHPRWRHVQQNAAGGGSFRHHTGRGYCFVRPLRAELCRKQFCWRKISGHGHPNPHLYERRPGAGGYHSSAISSSLEEVSPYSLLDLYHSVGIPCFILAESAAILLQSFRHSANVAPAMGGELLVEPGRRSNVINGCPDTLAARILLDIFLPGVYSTDSLSPYRC